MELRVMSCYFHSSELPFAPEELTSVVWKGVVILGELQSHLEVDNPNPIFFLQYAVNCNSVQNLPTISFTINGISFPLPPTAYILNVCIMALNIIHLYYFSI